MAKQLEQPIEIHQIDSEEYSAVHSIGSTYYRRFPTADDVKTGWTTLDMSPTDYQHCIGISCRPFAFGSYYNDMLLGFVLAMHKTTLLRSNPEYYDRFGPIPDDFAIPDHIRLSKHKDKGGVHLANKDHVHVWYVATRPDLRDIVGRNLAGLVRPTLYEHLGNMVEARHITGRVPVRVYDDPGIYNRASFQVHAQYGAKYFGLQYQDDTSEHFLLGKMPTKRFRERGLLARHAEHFVVRE